jgi:hypothetical protein
MMKLGSAGDSNLDLPRLDQQLSVQSQMVNDGGADTLWIGSMSGLRLRLLGLVEVGDAGQEGWKDLSILKRG